MPEPKLATNPPPTPPRSAAQEIFLSPRVVDRKAFVDFGKALKELTRRAEVGAENLRAAAAEAQAVRDGLRDAGTTQQMKIELAAKALAAVDQRTDQARRLLDGAAAAMSRLDDARQEADKAINSRLSALTVRLDEVERSIEPRVAAFHQGLSTAIADAERRVEDISRSAGASAAPVIESLSALVQRALALAACTPPDAPPSAPPTLADVLTRAGELQRSADSALRSLDEVRARAEQASASLAGSIAAAAPTVEDASSVQAALEAAVSEARRLTSDATDAMRARTQACRADLEAAIAALVPPAADATSDLKAALASSLQSRDATTAAGAAAREACDRVTVLLSRLEPWRGLLLDSSTEAPPPLPQPIRGVIDAVRVDIRRDLTSLAGALHAIADRAAGALDR